MQGAGLIESIHAEFVTNMASFDAGIVTWSNKRIYDGVRPFSAVQEVYGTQEVTAWGGPGEGTVTGAPPSMRNLRHQYRFACPLGRM